MSRRIWGHKPSLLAVRKNWKKVTQVMNNHVNIYLVASPQMNMTLMKHIIDVQKSQEATSCPYSN